jgi:hypothetical protein
VGNGRITPMKNKILLLLPLLLITAATQCMEQAIVTKPRTMQDIRNDRDEIYKERFKNGFYDIPLDHVLFQFYWSDCLEELKKQIKPQSIPTDCIVCYTPYLKNCISFRKKEYSFLGLATIAIKSEYLPNESHKMTIMRVKNLLNTENPEQVPFKQKKEHIQELFKLDFEPASQDKYFAILEKWERCNALLMIKRMCTLLKSPLLSEMNVPQEIIKFISLLMWEAEESLL